MNNKIEIFKWYKHKNNTDVAIKIMGSNGNKDSFLVGWWNISSKKRKFFIDYEWISQDQFNNSPYWMDQGEWIENLPLFP